MTHKMAFEPDVVAGWQQGNVHEKTT